MKEFLTFYNGILFHVILSFDIYFHLLKNSDKVSMISLVCYLVPLVSDVEVKKDYVNANHILSSDQFHPLSGYFFCSFQTTVKYAFNFAIF